MSETHHATIETVLSGAGQLYSLPAVANETLRLTQQSKVDVRALRDCIERDPALTAKLLRVVNSSLYGLSNRVGSLDQAIALLGVTPLRLLVLGFSLPDKLTAGLTAEALTRYWGQTLTRAAAARSIAQSGWGRLGDEAFIVGMMQGVGQLVLLQQLGDEYAELLQKVADTPAVSADELGKLELRALGFDHRLLSARLLRKWRLPETIAKAVELQTAVAEVARLNDSRDGELACLAQSARLATLLTQLVYDRRLSVLPELVEQGERFCGLTKKQLNSIVEPLQERVGQLAGAMAVSVDRSADYRATLVEAQAVMAVIGEQAIGQMIRIDGGETLHPDEEQLVNDLLAETARLTQAMERLKQGDEQPTHGATHAAQDGPKRPHAAADPEQLLAQRLEQLLSDCRLKRKPLSLVLIETRGGDPQAMPLRAWLGQSAWADNLSDAGWLPLSEDRLAVLQPGADRVDATRLWSDIASGCPAEIAAPLNAGVAGVCLPPKGFEPRRLIEAAERCLVAAVETVGPATKGIEVY